MEDIIKYKNTEYTIFKKKEDGTLVLKPLYKTVITKNNLEELSKYDFCNSSILIGKINDNNIQKNKYKCILQEMYNIINNGSKIIKYTSLNIDTLKRKDKGYYYLKSLGISIQGVDSNKSLYEICNQSKINNIKLEIKINLNNNDIIIIQIN